MLCSSLFTFAHPLPQLLTHQPGLGASVEAAQAAAARLHSFTALLPSFLHAYPASTVALMLAGGPRLLERLVEAAPPKPGGGLSPAVLVYLAEARQATVDMSVVGDVKTTEAELEESAGWKENLAAERRLELEAAVEEEAARAAGKGGGKKKSAASRRTLTPRGSPPPKGLRRGRS